jgi:hypothetical protein
MSEFRDSAPSAPAVFYRSYSRRKPDGTRESYPEAITRTVNDLADIGGLTEQQRALCLEMGLKQHAFPSGRALWVAGTEWAKKPENFSGYYNCHGGVLTGTHVFGRLMDLAMCGTGTGVLLEKELTEQLPPVSCLVNIVKTISNTRVKGGSEQTTFAQKSGDYVLQVGDSRKGWVDAYQALIDAAIHKTGLGDSVVDSIDVILDLSQIRQKGQKLKGFGGVANPIKLGEALTKVTSVLNKAFGRKLTPIECCLVVDEAASAVVAGNLRRSAGIRLFSSDDQEAKVAKLGLYKQDENGNWSVDPERESLRLANHTICYHHKPSYEELLASVQQQFHSGEGAIQFSPEAIARANADLIDTDKLRRDFLKVYTEQGKDAGREFLKQLSQEKGVECDDKLLDHRITRYSANPCFAPETLILTKAGGVPISDLVGKTVTVFDGAKWVEIDNFRVTAENQKVFKVTLASGTEIEATEYHSFILDNGTKVELKDLEAGMELLSIGGPSPDNEIVSVEYSRVCEKVYCCTVPDTHSVTLSNGIVTGQCHEIVGNTFQCNLGEVHLNTISPGDLKTQHEAFYSTGLMVASLLQHKFPDEELQYSREVDPIVAVCLSGLFDFFVSALGVEWLDWMIKGRKTGAKYRRFTELERGFLESWRESARQGVADYCAQAGLKMPNRYTAVQPSGSKALLTGASSGWHPPKSQRFIRRITFGIEDPIVAALRDYGYSVIPAQSARDEEGNLLDDVNDPRVREVLVEIPTEVSWANLPGADQYDLGQIPVESQMGLYMQVQRYYSTHTTSATVEFREHEIEKLAKLVYDEIQNDGGYIGVAMLARFDANATFPRLPFEPIDKQTYDRMMARIKAYRVTLPEDVTVLDLLKPYDTPGHVLEPQDTACANGACLAKIEKEEAQGLL